MELNDEEILELLNRLLEQLQRANYKALGSIVLNIYKQGSQHVDTIQTQIIGAQQPLPNSLSPTLPKREGRIGISDVLSTDEAMGLWQKAQEAGYVDENYQPLISRTQAALLADMMAERLGIREKWKVFETLWNRKYMRSDYNLALTQQQSLDFQDELKQVLGG